MVEYARSSRLVSRAPDPSRYDAGFHHGLSTAGVVADNLPPPDLRRAIEAATATVPLRDLRAAAARLSAEYRAGGRTRDVAWTDLDRLAYAAARMPATWRAIAAALGELRLRCPTLRLRSLLDIGCGPGTALWAAWTTCGELRRATLLDRDPAMTMLGQRLLAGGLPARQVAASWWRMSASELTGARSHDLVVAGYLLAELDAASRRDVVERAWAAAEAALVLVEPGSIAGYRRILEAREQLLSSGAQVVAPCPHAAPCPLPAGDWCHFGARLGRSSLQRRLKQGVLGYEDEKYAYLVAVRGTGQPAPARVIRRPRAARARITLRLCRPDGVRDETVEKAQRAEYRLARRLAWGAAWAPPARR